MRQSNVKAISIVAQVTQALWEIYRPCDLWQAVELKLTGIALNRSKNHIGERTTDRGLQVGFFY